MGHISEKQVNVPRENLDSSHEHCSRLVLSRIKVLSWLQRAKLGTISAVGWARVYTTRNARLDEAQAGNKITGINMNNLRYADDTILMAASEEDLKSLLMKVKEESEKVGLKHNIQVTKIMASGPITSWQIDGETVETVTDFILGLQNHCRW